MLSRPSQIFFVPKLITRYFEDVKNLIIYVHSFQDLEDGPVVAVLSAVPSNQKELNSLSSLEKCLQFKWITYISSYLCNASSKQVIVCYFLKIFFYLCLYYIQSSFFRYRQVFLSHNHSYIGLPCKMCRVCVVYSYPWRGFH